MSFLGPYSGFGVCSIAASYPVHAQNVFAMPFTSYPATLATPPSFSRASKRANRRP